MTPHQRDQPPWTDAELRAISRQALRDATEPQRGFNRRALVIGVFAVLAAALLVLRYKYIQSHIDLVESELGLKLVDGDELLDIERDIGRDRNDYFKLRLTPATYQKLSSRLAAAASTKPSMFTAEWPWWAPDDAVIVNTGEYGSTYLFSPSKRLVYVYSWSM